MATSPDFDGKLKGVLQMMLFIHVIFIFGIKKSDQKISVVNSKPLTEILCSFRKDSV